MPFLFFPIFYGICGRLGFTIVNLVFSHKYGQFSPSSRFRNSSGFLFFKICSHIFMIFEVKFENWSNDYSQAETGIGAKKRVILRREIFSL